VPRFIIDDLRNLTLLRKIQITGAGATIKQLSTALDPIWSWNGSFEEYSCLGITLQLPKSDVY
jgi:hypothetical protein